MSKTTKPRVRSTAKYKALIDIGLSDEQAMAKLAPTETNAPLARLLAAGFSEAEAATILGATPAKPAAPAAPVQSAEDALLANSGMVPTRGRVYLTAAILEAGARVLKTGTPEIVKSSGAGRVSAVLLSRKASLDVACQNLVVSA